MENKANIGPRIVLEGEAEYRQSINNVNRSMQVLKSELKAVAAEYQDNANSLEALRAKNEVLTKEQKEQEKMLQLLRGALDEASKQYGENSSQVQNWQIKVNKAYAELQKINKELGQNEKYMKEAEESTDKTAKSIDEFGKRVKTTKEETLKFGDVLKANLTGEAIIRGVEALGRAIKDVATKTVNVVKETAAYADNILTLSAQTGIATDTLQELNYMAELTDTSLDTITSTMARNIRSMNSAKEGTKLYADAYKALGIEITNADGQIKDSQTIYWQAIDALGKMANETERDAIAMQLFGRSAQDLNPLIKVGKDQISAFAQEARDMGAVLSEDTLKGLGETDDALQRMYQQMEISKRVVGQELAPAFTGAFEKITKKIGEVDDEFADFAGGAMEDVTDGFIWLIDNIDLVSAGLKGVAAAFITKKAADGVTYAINAYRTLTTTTQAATAAQVAFNTASKANVIGAIASVVIGLGTAIYSYAKNAETATKATEEMIASMKKGIDERKENKEEIEAETAATKQLADSLYELAEKENKTNSEKQQMVALVEELNDLMPDLNLAIDEQTGLLSLQRDELQKIIDKQLEYNMVIAAQEDLQRIAKEKYNAEKALKDLLEEQVTLEEKAAAVRETLSKTPNVAGASSAYLFGAVGTDFERFGATRALENNKKAVKETEALIDELAAEYKETMEYIGNHSIADRAIRNVSDIGDALETFAEKYAKAVEIQSEVELGSLEDRLNIIKGVYDEAEDMLEDRLKAEEKALKKSHERQVELVEEAQKEEMRILEKNHKEKLAFIDEEYIEKMKLVDEERYKELKAIQNELDDIENKEEAEERARKLAEEAEKRAELNTRIETAKTIEEKLDAQKDLAKFEEEIARERLKTERALQKDILKEKKDKINDAYDVKIKALEEEKKAEKEKAEEQYKADQEVIKETYKFKLQVLADEQEAERDALKEKQEEYKEYLKKQRELAHDNAKKIYEDDLALYKLNQALKYDKALSDEEAMKKLLRDYANQAIYNEVDVVNASKILQATSLQEMLKYYNPEALASVPATSTPASIDYSLIKNAMTSAVKSLNLNVVLDKKIVGTIVEETVNNMLR